ncbi:DrmE family protein [Anaerosporobacter sp.]|uniref:DrmE family protein n=1 Tax=Anaerosporobacter sp. TaxID=1872529 RepID=UPI00286F4C1C|nr:DrmE family protein [Anaerosporobacter sp.]
MDNEKIIRDLISKCEIYYDDSMISSEDIIRRYMHFFFMQFDTTKKTTSFVFHTGSPCFDIVSFAVLMLVCFNYNLSSNDELLQSLEEGDMVLFKGERYHWNGIKTMSMAYGSQPTNYIILTQDPKGKNGVSTRYITYENNKHLVRPYLGESIVTDGRGIRKYKSDRNEFLSRVLGVAESDVPSTLNISVVVIADKSVFLDMCHHLRISYIGGKSIQLTDIVPVSYFTRSGEEFQIGKNPAKAEAVIKVVSNVSAARDIVLDKLGNKVIGVLATNVETLAYNASEFKDLIRRKSLRFASVIAPYNAETSNMVVEQYEDANIFACTKEVLSSVSANINVSNKLTRELNQQVLSIVGHEIDIFPVDGCWLWNEYKQIKDTIYAIKQSNWNQEEKETFIKTSLGLVNLFTTAFFPIAKMEEAICNSVINASVASPADRIQELFTVGKQSISMKESCMAVAQALLDMYENMKSVSYKEKELLKILSENKKKKVAIVFPKGYYTDIFRNYYNAEGEYNNVVCSTANRFDSRDHYDFIIVVSDVVGKRFDSLQCYSSSRIIVLLYDCEGKLFRYRKKQFAKSERKLNARVRGLRGADYERAVSAFTGETIEELPDETIKEYADLNDFIENAGLFDIRRLIANGSSNRPYIGTAEVNYVGTFITGEQILFSKNYAAVLFNHASQKVTETSPEKLAAGDVLVFTKRDNYTRNIVDMIFEQLIKTKKLSERIQEATDNSLYWKIKLCEYKEQNCLTYRAIAKELKKFGSTLQEVSIRQWLDDESYIVGPRDEKTMEMIAKLTNDEYLLANFKDVFEDCRIVRHYRRDIRSLIAQAINDKLSNKIPELGSVFEVVYEHIEKLSETMELENVYELDKTVFVVNSLVNRPITETEVIL